MCWLKMVWLKIWLISCYQHNTYNKQLWFSGHEESTKDRNMKEALDKEKWIKKFQYKSIYILDDYIGKCLLGVILSLCHI